FLSSSMRLRSSSCAARSALSLRDIMLRQRTGNLGELPIGVALEIGREHFWAGAVLYREPVGQFNLLLGCVRSRLGTSEVDGGKCRNRQPGVLPNRLLHFQLYVAKHQHRLDPRLDDLFGQGAGVDTATMTRIRGSFARSGRVGDHYP